MRMTLSFKHPITDEQIADQIKRFESLGVEAFYDDGLMYITCPTEESERMLLDALALMPKIQ